MKIEVGSTWVDDDYGLDIVVKSIIAAAFEKTKVVYDVFDNTGDHLGYNSCTYELFLDSKTPKECSYEDDQNLNYRMGFNDGWYDCEASFELGNEFTDSIQEQAYDEGYDQAIDDLIEAGVIEGSDEDYSDECYSEYEFGDVEDGEEEYCFSKELDKILNGAFVVDTKSDGVERKHSHYFKDVRHLDYIDVYQVCKLFPIDDDSGAITHARKKLLVAGGRGAGKDMIKDITEARDTLNRYLQIEGIE